MFTSTSDEPSSSVLCGCCRFGSKNRKLDESVMTETRLYQPAMTFPLNDAAYQRFPSVDVPEIVISTPGIYTAAAPETDRGDVFTTARTSRPEESNQYDSMNELVRKIRTEAGISATPRIAEMDEVDLEITTVTQLRIEGLAELPPNNQVPLPSVSSEYYSRTPTPEGVSNIQAVAPYRPSIHRHLGEVTFQMYTAFWKVYSVVITFIALILQNVLPV